MTGNNLVSLYFHIPFCSRKCPYCHFFVLPNKQELKDRLLQALHLEWKREHTKLAGKEIVSIYFGGGTPSLFGPEAIGTVLGWIQNSAQLSPNCEITLEANPEEGKTLSAFASTGVNRMSLGVQSLDREILRLLGRKHSPEEALSTLETIYDAGIQNLSLDLMYEIPKQTPRSFENTLRQLSQLPLSHISLYNLTFEPETVFFKRKQKLQPLLPSPDENLEMLEMAVTHLENIGYERYEISAFAKKGYQSVHNTGYWTARPFLGFGPSAFSHWKGKRYRNVADLNAYEMQLKQDQSPVDFEEKLTHPHNILELLAVELRLLRGVSLGEFEAKHGALPVLTLETIATLVKRGWLSLSQNQLKLTNEGLLFYDSVASELI
ncbi:MAG: radical SAM family heme chaperone HemW [Chlamydiales bacterium]